jgi:hypothetical protein
MAETMKKSVYRYRLLSGMHTHGTYPADHPDSEKAGQPIVYVPGDVFDSDEDLSFLNQPRRRPKFERLVGPDTRIQRVETLPPVEQMVSFQRVDVNGKEMYDVVFVDKAIADADAVAKREPDDNLNDCTMEQLQHIAEVEEIDVRRMNKSQTLSAIRRARGEGVPV